MLYRAVAGFVPALLIALFATGAIPISSIFPGAGTASPRAAEAGKGEDGRLGPVRNAREAAAEQIGQLYGVRPDQASLMQEEMREAEAQMERIEERQKHRGEGWAPKTGGWGR
jgi:hypothetical protein